MHRRIDLAQALRLHYRGTMTLGRLIGRRKARNRSCEGSKWGPGRSGPTTGESMPREHVNFGTRPIYSLNRRGCALVHAGFDPTGLLRDPESEDPVWDRDLEPCLGSREGWQLASGIGGW